MTIIFEKNISVLRKTDPELADVLKDKIPENEFETMSTKTGLPLLRLRGITLHSRYDPLKEAEEWAAFFNEKIRSSSTLFVFGFGLGYHIQELCRKTANPVFVFEPELPVLRRAFALSDLTSFLPRIRIITDSRVPAGHVNGAVLEHRPSVNLNPEYFRSISLKISSLQRLSRGLRIAVVGPVYGGSLPVARYCSSALIKMGHKVDFIDNSCFEKDLFLAKDSTKNHKCYTRMVDLLTSFISEVVMARCQKFRPELILVLAQSPLSPECLERLRQMKVARAYWFVEDFRVMDYWKRIAVSYDYFFTIQRGQFFSELVRAGVRNHYYLPMAASPDVHRARALDDEERKYYGSDVSFVGAGYYNRRHFLNGLLDFNFKVWGTDWDMQSPLAGHIQKSGERLDTEEIVKIFNATKININLHSSTYHRGVNPFGDFVNPRTFEIMSCGGFQLADRRSELENLFDIHKEIEVFDDLDELRSKITHYLNNPGERESIARQGQLRVMRDHSYENRMSAMLDIVAEGGLEQPLWSEEGEDAEELIQEAGKDTELGMYLSCFREKQRISLSDIASEIHKGEGAISKTESLFLMMKEFAS